MIVNLPKSVHAHVDVLSSIFLALRDGVIRGRINHEKVEGLIAIASRSDLNVCRNMLEAILWEIR